MLLIYLVYRCTLQRMQPFDWDAVKMLQLLLWLNRCVELTGGMFHFACLLCFRWETNHMDMFCTVFKTQYRGHTLLNQLYIAYNVVCITGITQSNESKRVKTRHGVALQFFCVWVLVAEAQSQQLGSFGSCFILIGVIAGTWILHKWEDPNCNSYSK